MCGWTLGSEEEPLQCTSCYRWGHYGQVCVGGDGLCRDCEAPGKRGMGTECVHCSDELSQSDRAARCLKCNKLGHYPRCVRGYCRGCARQPPAGASRVEPKPCRPHQEAHSVGGAAGPGASTHTGLQMASPSSLKQVRSSNVLHILWPTALA